jgi:hypothetical protein
MSPNDPLFSEPASEPAPVVDGGDPAATPAATVGLTPEQFNEGIEQVVGGLREQVEGLSKAVAGMNQPATVEPTSTEPETDFLTAFSQNPEGAIKGMIAGEMKGLAPFLNTMIEGGSSAFVDIEAQRIDTEFGAGAWEKFYSKPMDEIVGMYQSKQPTALGDRGVIRREVDGITGRMVGKLVEHQQESKATVEKEGLEKIGTLQENILKEAANRTGLTGGIRRMPTGEAEVTEELKGYLAEREASIGLEQDPKDFLKQTSYGNTLEDYQAHQTKLSGGKE